MPTLTVTRELRIEPSTCCNWSCLFCPRESFARPLEVMSTELFARILARARTELPHLELCTVSGFGELATDPGWREKLALARSGFPRVHVVTNLSLIDDADLPLLARLATEVRVSLSAVDDRSLRAIHRPRGELRFETLARRLRRLAALRGPDLSLRLSCCAIEENASLLERWIAEWEPLVDGLEIWRPHNWVHGSFRELEGPRLASCGRPAAGPLQVQVDGTMNVCCFDANGEMLIGDLRSQSFAELLEGAPLSRIRELHRSGRADELPLCRRCDQREPPERRRRHLVYCTGESPELRIGRTSSGGEPLRELGPGQPGEDSSR